jgi:hypothetical protein
MFTPRVDAQQPVFDLYHMLSTEHKPHLRTDDDLNARPIQTLTCLHTGMDDKR